MKRIALLSVLTLVSTLTFAQANSIDTTSQTAYRLYLINEKTGQAMPDHSQFVIFGDKGQAWPTVSQGWLNVSHVGAIAFQQPSVELYVPIPSAMPNCWNDLSIPVEKHGDVYVVHMQGNDCPNK